MTKRLIDDATVKLALEMIKAARYCPPDAADTLLFEVEIILEEALAEQPAPVQQEPVAGEGKEFSERLKLCARNVAFVAAGRVDMSSAAMQEMFALIDHVCVGIDLPQPAQQEPVAWAPYLSDRADGVSGHYAIARWNPRGYREVWNLRRHAWGAYSDDVLCLEEADTLLRLIQIPTRKVESPQPAQRKPLTVAEVEQILTQHNYEIHGDRARYIVRMTEAAHNIKENT